MSSSRPIDFKWRHFHQEIILQCVRWYCKYGISYRDLEEMMAERGLSIDHTSLYRWVQHYAPKLKQRLEWYRKRYTHRWYLDKTYIKVKGQWKYLYRAIDEQGHTIDFYLSHRRNTKAAKRFLSKLIKHNPTCDIETINTDKIPLTIKPLKRLNKQVNYLSKLNIGKLNIVIIA